MFKKDFPIFDNNPGLVYLDSGASSQKPSMVIDGVSKFVANDYANIHRGFYSLSEKSEEVFYKSKEIVAKFLGCKSNEVIYSYNATYCINLMAQTLCKSKFLSKGDEVLLGMWEHHSNVLPWQILAEEYGFTVKFVNIASDYDIDREDFDLKYTDKVKVFACAHASNVTGKLYDVKKIADRLREDTFFVVDGSQAFPHVEIDVNDIGCDCYVFTGHKVLAYTGIGVMYVNRENIRNLMPMIAGGGTVKDVDMDGYSLISNADKFEAGTPNIIGAVSLLKALEYIESIGGMSVVWEHEKKLVEYALSRFEKIKDKVELIGPWDSELRTGVFSFIIPDLKNFNIVGEKFAEQNVCVRCGGHCAYPLHKFLTIDGTCRMSLYIYNNESDIDRFFEVLESIVG